MNIRFKKVFSAIFILTAFNYLFSQTDSENRFPTDKDFPEFETGYKVKEIKFDIKGHTKQDAILRNIVQVDENYVFKTEEGLIKYLNNLKQQMDNIRVFNKIDYDYEISSPENEIGLKYVTATYNLRDSYNVIVFPKPSLDMNSGIEIKLKLKDNNFLGSLESLNVDLNLNFGNSDYPDDYSKVSLGFNFDYDFPFNIGVTENKWKNDFSFSWEIGQESAEFSYETGLTFKFPLGRHKITLDLTQSVIKDNSYKEYDDELYFVENMQISLPLVLGYIEETTEVVYTPFISLNHNWDANGINSLNDDLNQTPVLKLGQSFSLSKVNWASPNNFRNGYEISSTQSIGWDYSAENVSDKVLPSVSGEVQLFKSFGWIGIAFNCNAFAGLNTTKKIGSYLRGALDNQTFKDWSGPESKYALQTPAALVFNFDMPVHVITTHWLEWSHAIFGDYETKPKAIKILAAVPRGIMKYVDFEMQCSPFIDIGLLKNRKTERVFSLKEGIYTCGLEILVYPSKWKSFVIRGCVGIDVSKKFLNGKRDFDSSWRSPAHPYEIYFGLGRQF